MANSKIVNDEEVERWFAADWPLAEMQRYYREVYHIETSPGMWTRQRIKRGYPRRIVHDPELMPWAVREEHRYEYVPLLLRAEARRRAGHETSRSAELDRWTAYLREHNLVVHYDPDTEKGWFYVDRQDGDSDLVAKPDPHTLRRNPRPGPSEKDN